MNSSSLGWMAGFLFATLFSASAATLSAYEGFDYPAGTQLSGGNGGSGFSGAWTGESSFLMVESSLPTGVPTSGRHIQVVGNGTVTRPLAQSIGAAGTVRYISVVAQALYQTFGMPPKGADRVGLTLNGNAGSGVFLGKVANQFNWALESAAGGGQVLGPPMFVVVPSTIALLVIKCEFFAGNDRFTLYVNPAPGQPEPATGVVKFDSDVGTITSVSFNVSSLEGFWGFDEIRVASTFADAVPALPANHPPTVANPIPDQSADYGAPFSFTFPADSFADSDAGQILSYSASGMPPGILFDGPTRTFGGVPSYPGPYSVTLTATDSASPPSNVSATFNIAVAKGFLLASADSATRAFGQTNPVFTGSLSGVVNNDNISASYASSATASSPPGLYQIVPTIVDPDGNLLKYNVTTIPGVLTIEGVQLKFDLSESTADLCWPTDAGAFALEYTDSLVRPISWQPVTTGLTTNGSTICVSVAPVPATPQLYYRLHLP